MKKIVLLSCDQLGGMVSDENLLIQELEAQGHEVTMLSWDVETDWSRFDAAIIRTTWDYVQRHQEFSLKLRLIAKQTRLFNPLEAVEWNIHKNYLKELSERGVAIVPTHYFRYPGRPHIPTNWEYAKFIVKPAISATAFKTTIVTREQLDHLSELHDGDWMLQPFLEEIKQGEISLHYFNKKFSHAIIKIPKVGDFRVQEEFGSEIRPYEADENLLKIGQKICDSVPFDLLYARVDLVPVKGQYLLMELELIEPSLYFRTNSLAPRNFVKALTQISSAE